MDCSADPAVISAGLAYLRTIGPVYAAVGATFMLTFASPGGGRPLWTLLAGTARLGIAAGSAPSPSPRTVPA